MRNLQKLLDRFSLARLKKLRAIFPKARKQYSEVLSLAAAERDRLEKLLPPDFSWAPLYELETNELILLNLEVLGLLDTLLQAYQSGLDFHQYLLDFIIRESETEAEETKWAGGHGGIYTEADLLGTNHAFQNSWRCMSIYGHFLNDIVKKVRNGEDKDDDDFFKAIKIDRTILTCPTFAARLARAEYFDEKDFMLRLHSSIKVKPHAALLAHQDLRSMLQVFQDLNIFDDLSQMETDLLFIEELKLYQDAGKDPARSLMRFIQRWKEQKASAT
jgi:hypothetical protein